MKKVLILALAGSFYMATHGCQIVLENDIDMWVAVTDLEANHPTELVQRKVKIKDNKNPDIRADLRVMIGPNPARPLKKESYRIKQIACSTSHIIPLTASSIINGTVDPAIFTVDREY